jgi:tetratricopeptide (TPR) repeat protein
MKSIQPAASGKVASKQQRFHLLIAHRSITVVILFLFFIPLLYLNSVGNDFTNWDDQLIYANPKIRSLDWKNVVDMFVPGQGTYQPVRVLSYAMDYRFWRLDPFGYHLTNLFFYLLTCLLLFFMTSLLLKHLLPDVSRDSSDRIALFTAFLFSAHPVHVEAVSWLAARKEVLQGFFLFLSFYLYLKAREIDGARRRGILLGSVFLTFLLAVLSKPSAVILPGLFLLYEITRKGTTLRSLVRERWVFFTVSGAISFIFILVLLKVGGVATAFLPFHGGSFVSDLIVAMNLVLYNIKLLAFTTTYSAAYTVTASFKLFSTWTMMVCGLTSLLIMAALWSRRKTSLFFFSFFWFLIAVSPFLNIFPISIPLADRYVYIASFGYCLTVGFLINRLYEVRSGTGDSVLFRAMAVLLFLVLLSGYSWVTMQQNRVWKNSFSLWSDAVQKYPEGNLANAMMGVVYMDQGKHQQALPYLEKAVRIRPTDVLSRKNLGVNYMKLGDLDKAAKEFRAVLQVTPEDENLKFIMAVLYGEQKAYPQSEEILNELIRKRPDQYIYYLQRGYLREKMGRLEQAIEDYGGSARLAPQQPSPYRQMGNLYLYERGDSGKAIECYTEAVSRMNPSDPKAEQLRWVIQDLASH